MSTSASTGNSESPTLGPILSGTVIVPDLADATAAYGDLFAYETEADGEIPAALATAWGAPEWSGRRYRLLSPGTGRPGGVRLIEKSIDISAQPLQTQGWRALEIVVMDVDALRERVHGPAFRVVGEPKGLTNVPAIRAMQVVGPGNVMHYLTTTVQGTAFQLPSATRSVDGIFVAVLACDIPAAENFYGTVFGGRPPFATPSQVPLHAVNRELGFPIDRLHSMLTLQLANRSAVELDSQPEELRDNRPPADDLPDGIPAMTFSYAGDLDALSDHGIRVAGRFDDPPYRGARVGVLIGPAGERLELVEQDSAS
jgi:catechol 2,3-dioxygenase-like lactoylglutathione lyase family enzyme